VSELYQKMKAKGVDMSWYERGRHAKSPEAIPLQDEKCSRASIYLLKQDGSLWTITYQGKPHKQVRRPGKQLPRSVYVCLCCKTQWNEALMEDEALVHPAA
jgi:hypothetical protein